MTEIEFEKALVELAHTFGWKVAGFRPAMTSKGYRTPVKYDGKGYPDLTLVNERHGEIVIAELKAQRGQLSPEQKAWREAMCACMYTYADLVSAEGCRPARGRFRYFVWRPVHSDQVATVLSFGRVLSWKL